MPPEMALSILGRCVGLRGFCLLFGGGGGDAFDDFFLEQEADVLFDLQQELAVFAGDKGAGDAFGAHAAGAADAVDVFLGGFGDIVVDDVGNRGDVEAAGGDIGGDQAGEFAFAELPQGLFAAGLREVAVNGTGGELFAFQHFGHAVGLVLGFTEHHHLFRLLGFDKVGQHRGLFILVDGDEFLIDFIDGHRLGHGVHVLGVGHVVVCQALDFLGHGRREQQGLPLLWGVLEDVGDVGQKADVEHLVGLVHDHHLNSRGIQVFAA